MSLPYYTGDVSQPSLPAPSPDMQPTLSIARHQRTGAISQIRYRSLSIFVFTFFHPFGVRSFSQIGYLLQNCLHSIFFFTFFSGHSVHDFFHRLVILFKHDSQVILHPLIRLGNSVVNIACCARYGNRVHRVRVPHSTVLVVSATG